MNALRVVAATAALAVLTACSGGSDKPTKDTASVPAPKGFDVPAGVRLTKAGSALALGKPASVVYRPGDPAASAVTVTVKTVTKGSIKDFRFFSLDAEAKSSTPFYVGITVKNEGPAGIAGGALPIYAHDSTNTNMPANVIVGTFKPCRPSTLPGSFAPGSSAELCMVYLLPKGRTLQTIDLQTDAQATPVTWKP